MSTWLCRHVKMWSTVCQHEQTALWLVTLQILFYQWPHRNTSDCGALVDMITWRKSYVNMATCWHVNMWSTVCQHEQPHFDFLPCKFSLTDDVKHNGSCVPSWTSFQHRKWGKFYEKGKFACQHEKCIVPNGPPPPMMVTFWLSLLKWNDNDVWVDCFFPEWEISERESGSSWLVIVVGPLVAHLNSLIKYCEHQERLMCAVLRIRSWTCTVYE